MDFILFIAFVVTQRLSELVLAKRNERWLLKQGAVEFGRGHYPFIVLLHTFFIMAMLAEYFLSSEQHLFNRLFFLFFFALLLAKAWVISSLGKYWNTRIYRVRGAQLVNKGPYKWIKHPNYIIVVGEIFVIPLVYDLYMTAIVFSLLNAVMLTIRIREENKALLV